MVGRLFTHRPYIDMMPSGSNYTDIQVSREVCRRINQTRKPGESADGVVSRLLDGSDADEEATTE